MFVHSTTSHRSETVVRVSAGGGEAEARASFKHRHRHRQAQAHSTRSRGEGRRVSHYKLYHPIYHCHSVRACTRADELRTRTHKRRPSVLL